jgi:chemotaxis protein methyltransferase CheR
VIDDTADSETNFSESVEAIASLAELEVQLMLEGLHRWSGYDLRGYAPTWIRRRLAECVRAENVGNVTALLERVLHDSTTLERVLYGLTVAAEKAPFADAEFLSQVARCVIPRLRTYPFFRVWVAGSGSKHDIYAIAILLHEAGLLDRARIYATEAAKMSLEEDRRGVFPRDMLHKAEEGYRTAGGTANLTDYLTESFDGWRFNDALRANILFARHDLASEGSFNEFEAVFAHEPLAMYSRALAYRAHQTLYESTTRFGFMCVASKEMMTSSPHRHAYEPVADCERIIRRVR